MSVVNLFIHAPSTLVSAERRVPASIPLYDLKFKLESIVGIPPQNQILEIHSARTDHEQQQQLPGSGPFAASVRSTLVFAVPQNSAMENQSLEELGVHDLMAIKVLDTRPKELIQTFTDESLVEKYVMDDETYAKRRDTVLAFKQRNKLGRFDPAKDASSSTASADASDIPEGFTIGARCQIDLLSDLGSSGTNKRRGTIRYVGQTTFASGTWVGVEYDEPVGKNDGSVAGERYFTCRPNFGSFVRPDKVQVGDYPAEDIDLEEDSIDDDEEM